MTPDDTNIVIRAAYINKRFAEIFDKGVTFEGRCYMEGVTDGTIRRAPRGDTALGVGAAGTLNAAGSLPPAPAKPADPSAALNAIKKP